jgi:hypothetical protein
VAGDWTEGPAELETGGDDDTDVLDEGGVEWENSVEVEGVDGGLREDDENPESRQM